MSEDRNCQQAGHCWHTLDGSLFQRHKDRVPGKVDVHCCWCPQTAALEGFAKNTVRMKPPPFHPENHGDYLLP